MRALVIAAFAALALAAFAACTSVSGLTSDTPPEDGGSGAETSITPDATLDGKPPTPDAGTEAGSDASPATYCSLLPGSHTFCDDFDGDGMFASSWSGKNQIGGTVGRVAGGVSPPWAYGAITTVTATDVALEKEFGQTVRSIVCELDLKVAQFGQPSIELLRLTFTSSQTSQYYYEINLASSSSGVQEYKEYAGGGVSSQAKPLPVPAVGVWKHVKVSSVLKPSPIGGGNPRVGIMIDGKEEAALDVAPPSTDITRVTLRIGVKNGLAGATNEWKVHFDNVVCDVL